jgi:hypothetical protein
MGWNMVENETTRAICRALNCAELRSGRLSREVSSAMMSDFKQGKTTKLNGNKAEILKLALNTLYVDIRKFTRKEVQCTDAYLKELLDIADLPALNWAQLYRNVSGQVDRSPNPAMVRWSYYNSTHKVKVDPSGDLVERYRPFFEQMRWELKMLSGKLKIG